RSSRWCAANRTARARAGELSWVVELEMRGEGYDAFEAGRPNPTGGDFRRIRSPLRLVRNEAGRPNPGRANPTGGDFRRIRSPLRLVRNGGSRPVSGCYPDARSDGRTKHVVDHRHCIARMVASFLLTERSPCRN